MDSETKELCVKLQLNCQEQGLKLRNDWECYRLIKNCDGDIKEATERVKKMREFETKWDLDNIDPVEAYDAAQKLCPGAFVGYTGKDKLGRWVFYANASKFDPSVIGKDRKTDQMFFKCFATLMEIPSGSLEDFEKGYVFVENCKGFSLKNMSLKLEKEMSWIYQRGYPTKTKLVFCFNAGAILRGVMKLCRAFLTKKMQERIQIESKSKKLLEFVDENNLPLYDETGNVPDDQIRKNYIELTKRYLEFSSSFKI